MNQVAETKEQVLPFSCLVIQLAGEGDVYQSLMALKAAKHLYPQMEITLLVSERFADVAKKTAWLQKVIALPEKDLIDPVLACQGTEKEALRKLARWVSPILGSSWDMVVNWTFSEASSYLTALVPAPIKLGYSRCEDSTQVCADVWSQYFQGIVQTDFGQNIHVTDILTTQLLTALHLQLGSPADAGHLPVSSRHFFNVKYESSDYEHFLGKQGTWVGLQLGSSQPGEAMTSDDWAQLGSMILRRHENSFLILFGSEQEQSRARSVIEKIAHDTGERSRIISVVGEPRLERRIQALIRCRWLISFDSSLVHLASILGTRVIYLCNEGTLRLPKILETAPYGNGHVIACNKASNNPISSSEKKSQSFAPDMAYAVWSYYNAEYLGPVGKSLTEHLEQVGMQPFFDQYLILRSRIRHGDDGGGVTYESQQGEPMTFDGWSAAVLGQCARGWYCGWIPPLSNELQKPRLSPVLIQEVRKLSEATELLAKVCQESERTAQTLYEKSNALPSSKIMNIESRSEIDMLARKLNELEELMSRLANAQSALRVFPIMQKIMMHNLEGQSLSELALQTIETHRRLKQGVEIFNDWISYTLKLARPSAVKSVTKVKNTNVFVE